MKNKLKCFFIIFLIIVMLCLKVQADKVIKSMTYAEIIEYCSAEENLEKLYKEDTEILQQYIDILNGDPTVTIDKRNAQITLATIIRNRQGIFYNYTEICNYYNYELNGNLDSIDTEILEKWVDMSYSTIEQRKIRNHAMETIKAREKILGMEISVPGWKPSINTTDNTYFLELTGKIVGVIQTVGSVISVITLAVIGIKYMFVSIEEKAKYKEKIIPYVVGCLMLFGTINLTSIIYEIVNK